jgi:hypothetical protein
MPKACQALATPIDNCADAMFTTIHGKQDLHKQCSLTFPASLVHKNLGVTSNNLHPVHNCHLIVCFDRCILQDKSPNIVTNLYV